MSEQRVRLIDQLIQRAADELYEGKTPERVAGLLQILAGQEIGVQEARTRIAQKFGRGKFATAVEKCFWTSEEREAAETAAAAAAISETPPKPEMTSDPDPSAERPATVETSAVATILSATPVKPDATAEATSATPGDGAGERRAKSPEVRVAVEGEVDQPPASEVMELAVDAGAGDARKSVKVTMPSPEPVATVAAETPATATAVTPMDIDASEERRSESTGATGGRCVCTGGGAEKPVGPSSTRVEDSPTAAHDRRRANAGGRSGRRDRKFDSGGVGVLVGPTAREETSSNSGAASGKSTWHVTGPEVVVQPAFATLVLGSQSACEVAGTLVLEAVVESDPRAVVGRVLEAAPEVGVTSINRRRTRAPARGKVDEGRWSDEGTPRDTRTTGPEVTLGRRREAAQVGNVRQRSSSYRSGGKEDTGEAGATPDTSEDWRGVRKAGFSGVRVEASGDQRRVGSRGVHDGDRDVRRTNTGDNSFDRNHHCNGEQRVSTPYGQTGFETGQQEPGNERRDTSTVGTGASGDSPATAADDVCHGVSCSGGRGARHGHGVLNPRNRTGRGQNHR